MSNRSFGARQSTVAREIELTGTGVHSGVPVSVILHPAEADVGFRFLVSRRGRVIADIPATVHSVKNLTLCTVIGDDEGNTVSTVEHLLAALHGMGVDNCYIEIDSKEVPIMDGSSRDFVDALDVAGLMELSAPRKYIRVIKPICVQDGDCLGEFTPNGAGFRLDVSIDFECPAIGRQNYVCDLSPRVFRTELSRARTFGFMRDVEQLWQKKLALGANLNNTVAIDDEHRVLNAGGLRYTNEFVRHKMLDAVGDLALAGLPILGTYRSVRGGHRLNANALKALLADKSAWVIDSATVAASVPLPNPRGVVETAATVVSRVS